MRAPLSRVVSIVSLVVAFALPAAAQNENFIELAKIDDYVQYTDCWGYEDPVSGNEYAILATTEGVTIYNITDPFNPYQTGFFFAIQFNPYRDCAVFNGHVYAVSQGLQSGLQIIDITNPEAPVARPTWDAFTARSIVIDPETGVGYIAGWHPESEAPKTDGPGGAETMSFARGFLAIDLADPANPQSLAALVEPYFQQLAVADGKVFAGAINNGGRLEIVRVSDLPALSSVASVSYADGRSYSTAVSADARHVFVGDEMAGIGSIRVFDAGDSASVVQVASVPPVPGASVHNIMSQRDTLYCAWYEAGVRVFDCTEPAQPRLIGSFDTGPDSTGGVAGFVGCWGVFPPLPSGVMLSSDIFQGMHLLYYADQIGGVSGTVTHSITQLPIADVEISVPGFFDRRVQSGVLGAYGEIVLPGGTYTVTASAEGYYPSTLLVTIIDGVTSDLDFHMVPQSFVGVPGEGASGVTVLEEPRPNPGRDGTTFTFELAREGVASLILYDASGRQVRTLAAGGRSIGRHAVRWDGRDDSGRAVASGTFVARLLAEREVRTTKVLLTR